MSEFKTYRHTITGKIGPFPVDAAQYFPELVEVDSDAPAVAAVVTADEPSVPATDNSSAEGNS